MDFVKKLLREHGGSGEWEAAEQEIRGEQQRQAKSFEGIQEQNSTRVSTLESQLQLIQDRLERMEKASQFRQRVDLVRIEGFPLFVYQEDFQFARYEKIAPGEPRVVKSPFPETITPADVLAGSMPEYDANYVCMAHYWRHGIDFCYIDVGGKYGLTPMETRLFMRSCGKENPLVTFEPGVAAELLPFNLALNGYADSIHWERAAVSNSNLPGLLYCELAHPENNRIVNRTPNEERTSFPVRQTSLDSYVAAHAEYSSHANYIIKIDTQGAEHEVIEGMAGILENTLSSAVVEFVPAALDSRIDPVDFLTKLDRTHMILSISVFKPKRFFNLEEVGVLPAADFKSFVAKLREDGRYWTDLLILPRRLPGCEELAATIAKNGGVTGRTVSQ